VETSVRSKFYKKCSRTFKIAFVSVPVNNKLTNYRLLNKFRKTGVLMNKKGYRNPRVFSEETLNIIGARLRTSARQF